jgi:iron complex outermembrane recepter protein
MGRINQITGSFVGFIIAALPMLAAGQDVRPGPVLVVRDSSGAAMPGVTIKIINEVTTAGIEGVSDAEGRYQAGPLIAGPYRVEAMLDGFEPVLRRVAIDDGPTSAIELTLHPSRLSESVVVTARRVEEVAQEVPIPVSVVSGALAAATGSFNVNRLKELIPTVQFYSSNPRNTAINIRGLGAPFGLTNDGIDPGVGFYIDGVYYARPAAATLDFIDLERTEVLRGPQGTLYGKNTTAGAINITTRKPTFAPESRIELTFGGLDLVQAKASASGPLSQTVAARLSFSGTTRRGTIDHVGTGEDLNGLNNLGFRGQVLYTPSSKTAVTLSADSTRQRPRGYAQVVAGVAPTERVASRQYAQIAADLRYNPPSFDAFDRLSDADTPHRADQTLGGASVAIERTLGAGRLSSITAWRYWDWDPSNDRDFLGLPVTTISANPSTQRQWTQEVRYSGSAGHDIGVVAGAFLFHQTIDSTGRQEQGAAAARFLLAPTAAAATPGLLDGYGQTSDIHSSNLSAALFGQLEWPVTDRLRLLPGLRFNYDDKAVDFNAEVYGGLATDDPVLVALQRSILAPQAYQAGTADTNLSGQLTAAYRLNPRMNGYATYATTYKPIGLNLSGVPTDALGRPALEVATVKPERERHLEAGLKTEPAPGITANVTLFDTNIRDYQANVVNAQVGVLRGYLANAEEVQVRGIELDGNVRVSRRMSVYAAVAYTEGKYVSFPDAPPPLEETGGPQVKDISGSDLPGISRWALSIGGEYARPAPAFGARGEVFAGLDGSYRSSFSSSATASRFLVIDGYALLNARLGYRWGDGWSLSLWSRNLLNQDYFELLSAAPGGSGLYVGLPGDLRTVGVSLQIAIPSNQ